MNLIIKRIQELERLENEANRAEAAYSAAPENLELEKLFDAAYKAEFDEFVSLAKLIVQLTDSRIDFNTAKKIIMVRRAELKALFA